MHFHAPSNIYGPNLLRIFMDDLGGPKAVHKYLGVSERTVFHWLASGRVPRAAVLALFWESKYGRGQIFTDQVNEIRLLYGRVCLLQEQYQRAKDIITGLRAMHAGSANEPLFEELLDLNSGPTPTFAASTDLPSTAEQPSSPLPRPAPASSRAKQAMQAFARTRAASQ